ncbi:hypothetical protein [Actinokineospora cianjurensis]|uniref:Uncharacterized protein n=1 Tax=Actinokineospora cianjurensis TaxID=585224 RepID=A0A421B2B5_9PSEU|nr:hypothetical protein [Actinokineospora cianjurensis]RLK58436.1 hypothetical protein CLV68_4539 [Actinokineospora cianjurensis]
MPSAREIRTKLRRREADERRKREDAVVTAAEAAATAVKTRADNDAALREAFEAALKSGEDTARVATLRETFEAALADNPQVVEAERAAGRAVIAATAFKVTQVELVELTEQRVEDLRRWAQMAKLAEPVGASLSGGEDSGRKSPARPVASGFAVVSHPVRDDDSVVGDVSAAG